MRLCHYGNILYVLAPKKFKRSLSMFPYDRETFQPVWLHFLREDVDIDVPLQVWPRDKILMCGVKMLMPKAENDTMNVKNFISLELGNLR